MTDDTDECGHIKNDGDPCTYTAKYEDGKCGHHTDVEGPEDAGRPTKLTKERQENIAHAIEQGASISEAARKNGIHRETFINWMNRGEDQDEGVFAEFFDRLTRARGQGEATYRTALMQIAIENNDTATLMTMLKQRYPDEWGDVDRGDQAGGSNIQLFNKAPEDMDALIDALDGE
jgi:transposase-like protein